MSRERDLNFFLVPKKVLVDEVMEEFGNFLSATIPALKDLSEESRADITEKSANYEYNRLVAEASVRTRYRLPDEILEHDIVDQAERERIFGIVKKTDAFVEEVGRGVSVTWLGEQRLPRRIYIISDHPQRELSWLGIPLEAYFVNKEDRNPPSIMAALTGFLDVADHPEDYSGTGPDIFTLGRDDAGDIKSYSIRYKGEHRPRTPWDFMHRDDLPIIQNFMNRASVGIDNVKAGRARVEFK